jgi:hypothetical protein
MDASTPTQGGIVESQPGSATPATCDVGSAAPAQSRYAGEWGLASLLLGGVLVLAALFMLMTLIWYLILINQVRPSRTDIRLAVVITGVLTGLFVVVCTVSVTCGVVGVRAAWARCQPGGLPVAGLVLSLLALLLWAAVAFSLIMNFVDFSRRGIV